METIAQEADDGVPWDELPEDGQQVFAWNLRTERVEGIYRGQNWSDLTLNIELPNGRIERFCYWTT